MRIDIREHQMPYRTTITIPDGQAAVLDCIVERLGLESRLKGINYLLTLAISQEQVRGGVVDSADAAQYLKHLVLSESSAAHITPAETTETKGQVPVTPATMDKNGTRQPARVESVGGR